ncbi:MAG: PAS domain-containing sensor histidine kinase [Sphingomonas sp.]
MNEGVVSGVIDIRGRLVSADPPLTALHRLAGGEDGGVLALPRLAAIARLARRLGLPVSREMVVAGEDGDLDLWVRAVPDAGAVRLAIGGWTRRPALLPPAGAEAARERDFIAADADWIWSTDAALRLTTLSPGGAIGRGDPLTRLFALEADADGAMPLLEALAAQRRFDDQLATVSGSGARVRLSGIPLIDGHRRFAGFRGGATVISDALFDTPEAEDAGAFGQRLDSALREPLDRIVACAETIRTQGDGPLRRDYAMYAADIAAAGRHLLALVGDLVDLQAIERPDFHVPPEPIDLADVARRAAGLLGVRAADRDVRVVRPDEAEHVPASGDFRRVLQILVNLIGNAVRYAPQGSVLSVLCAAGDGGASVTVADRGKGIASADQARIFEKFARVDPGEPGGTGLGLYISRRLARAMGGDITVESAPGEGARFTLTLPR